MRSLALACALLLAASLAAGGANAPPRPKPVERPPAKAVEDAITRGADFLIADQNPDGSWGSARNTKGLNIYAPVPGAHHAFRGAVTSLAVSALIEVNDDRPQARKALRRGEDWLVEHLPSVRRATPRAVYNVWTHAYGIQALTRMMRRSPGDEARQERLRGLIREQIELLRRYESVYGGWSYYDFHAHTRKPSGRPMSFTTAAVLVALREAQEAGVKPPPTLVRRALAVLRRQQKPDFSYLYSGYGRWRPMAGINRPGGSLGRSQACNVARRLWGEEAVTDAVLTTWLDRLFARNEWLGMGRKRPVPHESWFAVAGYFYYFGHYYAALCIEQLPADEQPFYQHHLARVLLRLQEKDGSWWDYPLYDYHRPYGTAFALMALRRCRASPATDEEEPGR
jgi:hypothetical protein